MLDDRLVEVQKRQAKQISLLDLLYWVLNSLFYGKYIQSYGVIHDKKNSLILFEILALTFGIYLAEIIWFRVGGVFSVNSSSKTNATPLFSQTRQVAYMYVEIFVN